jgi:hypothetical protein
MMTELQVPRYSSSRPRTQDGAVYPAGKSARPSDTGAARDRRNVCVLVEQRA